MLQARRRRLVADCRKGRDVGLPRGGDPRAGRRQRLRLHAVLRTDAASIPSRSRRHRAAT